MKLVGWRYKQLVTHFMGRVVRFAGRAVRFMVVPLAIWDAAPQGRHHGRSPTTLGNTIRGRSDRIVHRFGHLRPMRLVYFVPDT